MAIPATSYDSALPLPNEQLIRSYSATSRLPARNLSLIRCSPLPWPPQHVKGDFNEFITALGHKKPVHVILSRNINQRSGRDNIYHGKDTSRMEEEERPALLTSSWVVSAAAGGNERAMLLLLLLCCTLSSI